jgi:hypothetical protein
MNGDLEEIIRLLRLSGTLNAQASSGKEDNVRVAVLFFTS